MARKMKDFQKVVELIEKFEGAIPKIYSTDMNEADAARAIFEETIRKILGPRIPMPDYSDPDQVRQYRDHVRMYQTNKVVADMRHVPTRDDMISQVTDDKFAKYALSTTPVKTGNATHDRAVKAHEDVRKWSGKIQQVAKNYGAVAGEVEDVVKKAVTKHTQKDTSNSNFTPAEIADYAAKVASLARAQGFGLEVLSGLRDEAVQEFDKVYDPKKVGPRAQYAKENIRTLSTSGTGAKLRENQYQAGRDLEGIASAA
jgi:hypothetical protein